MKLRRKAETLVDTGEVLNGERITESAGYIPTNVRVQEMVAAGQRLVDYRKGHYDFPPGVEVSDKEEAEFNDPTRSANYDLADAARDTREVNARIRDARERSVKEREKAAKAAEKPVVQAPEVPPPKGD